MVSPIFLFVLCINLCVYGLKILHDPVLIPWLSCLDTVAELSRYQFKLSILWLSCLDTGSSCLYRVKLSIPGSSCLYRGRVVAIPGPSCLDTGVELSIPGLSCLDTGAELSRYRRRVVSIPGSSCLDTGAELSRYRGRVVSILHHIRYSLLCILCTSHGYLFYAIHCMCVDYNHCNSVYI